MSKFICIRATLLADRYHAGDWPPSPARLFQALVAGAKTCANARDWAASEPALRALESKPPTEILTVEPIPLSGYSISVPNNDSDRAAGEWAAGREFDPATLRTMKSVAPLGLPSPAPGSAHAYYIWERELLADLGAADRLAGRLHTLGWGLDMAWADALALDGAAHEALLRRPGILRYRLDPAGEPMPCPAPGLLDELLEVFQRKSKRASADGVDADIRPRKYSERPYRLVGSSRPPLGCFELRRLDNSDRWFTTDASVGYLISAWLRHAAAEALRAAGRPESIVNEFVLGHGAGRLRHMSFVPLPTVHTSYADGAIRRAMILEPPGSDGQTVAFLRHALAAVALKKLDENGKSTPACLLTSPTANDAVIRRYVRRSTTWRSATPVILHGHNTLRRKFSAPKTEQLLSEALAESGLPISGVQEVHYQPAPYWPKLPAARGFVVPSHLAKWPRYHVAIRFRGPVTGPVLAGIGRHYGLGLFAAADEAAEP